MVRAPKHASAATSVLRAITLTAPARYDLFENSGDLDVAYTAPGLPRFRVNAFRQRGATSLALRVIPHRVPQFDDLSLPAKLESPGAHVKRL